MNIKITAYGIAKDIMQNRHSELVLMPGDSIATLKEKLNIKFPEFAKLISVAFAVAEEYQSEEYLLSEGDHVVIIPPVSGG